MDLTYPPKLDRKHNEESKSQVKIPLFISSFIVSCNDISSQESINALKQYPWSTLDSRSTLDRYSINTFVDTRLTWLTVGQVLTECWLSVGRVSAECRPSIDRDVSQVWVEMLIKCRLIQGIDQHSTIDAFSAHDPCTELILFREVTIPFSQHQEWGLLSEIRRSQANQ